MTEHELSAAGERIRAYCLERGASAVGVADVDILERIAPNGFGPRDVLPAVGAVISLGDTGCTQGTWRTPAKIMATAGASVSRIYRIAYGLSYFIEKTFGYPSVYCPPHVDPEFGARLPLQSLKLHAEVAGIGARSLAGDILLHPEFGMLYYASVFTEMPLPADGPMAENPCPAPSCADMYKESGRTPCQKFCPVQCLSGKIGENGEVAEMHFEMHKCAELCQQYENLPNFISDAIEEPDPLERDEILFGGEAQGYFYKIGAAVDTNAQCFECMRSCPVVTKAPKATPLRRAATERGEAAE